MKDINKAEKNKNQHTKEKQELSQIRDKIKVPLKMDSITNER